MLPMSARPIVPSHSCIVTVAPLTSMPILSQPVQSHRGPPTQQGHLQAYVPPLPDFSNNYQVSNATLPPPPKIPKLARQLGGAIEARQSWDDRGSREMQADIAELSALQALAGEAALWVDAADHGGSKNAAVTALQKCFWKLNQRLSKPPPAGVSGTCMLQRDWFGRRLRRAVHLRWANAAGQSIPGPDPVDGAALFEANAAVVYLSPTHSIWIPTTVVRASPDGNLYDLACRAGASIERIRPANPRPASAWALPVDIWPCPPVPPQGSETPKTIPPTPAAPFWEGISYPNHSSHEPSMLPSCMQGSFTEGHHTAEHAPRDPGLSMSPRLQRAQPQRSAPELPLQTVRDPTRNRFGYEDPPKSDLCRRFEWNKATLEHYECDRAPASALPLRTWDGVADRNVRREGGHNVRPRRRRSSSCSALPRSSDFHRNATTPPHNLEEPAVSSPPRRTPAARGQGVSQSYSPKKRKESKKERSVSPDKSHKKRADRTESPTKAQKEKEKNQKSEELTSSKANELKNPESPKQKRKSHKSPEKQSRARAVREGARHQLSQAESSDVIAEIKRLREKCERFLEDIAKEPQKTVKHDFNSKVPASCPAMSMTPPPRWIQSKDFSYSHVTATLRQDDLECTKAVTQTTGISPMDLFSGPNAPHSAAKIGKSSTSFVDQATSPMNTMHAMHQFQMMMSPHPAASPIPESLPSTTKVPQSPGTPLSPGTQHFIGWAQAAQRLCATGPLGNPTSSSSRAASVKNASSSNQKALDDLDAKICALLGSNQ
eukprot:gnl/MRDRNA2_/MRDRNA2_29800_c0_seq1.p1 gnl/MRDRNA2_/MRDRNA2_29800_c0~~gnl/MRDRNA2_/MRDRNA2_29800_c0_seq1.p1  ORF type:complete len:775 (+),score=129.22 gnl/MRDRNA2_/MRDRNA2_29800_c0_seq1:89-2413(+)